MLRRPEAKRRKKEAAGRCWGNAMRGRVAPTDPAASASATQPSHFPCNRARPPQEGEGMR